MHAERNDLHCTHARRPGVGTGRGCVGGDEPRMAAGSRPQRWVRHPPACRTPKRRHGVGLILDSPRSSGWDWFGESAALWLGARRRPRRDCSEGPEVPGDHCGGTGGDAGPGAGASVAVLLTNSSSVSLLAGRTMIEWRLTGR